jgi:hypothetical protein
MRTSEKPIQTTPGGSWLVPGNDLSRMYLIDVCANGSCRVRRRGEKMERGLLPVFSTDNEDDARSLIVLHCKLARDRSGVYYLNPSLFDASLPQHERVDQLDGVRDQFRTSYGRMLTRREGGAP